VAGVVACHLIIIIFFDFFKEEEFLKSLENKGHWEN